jgi:hypothetical protein
MPSPCDETYVRPVSVRTAASDCRPVVQKPFAKVIWDGAKQVLQKLSIHAPSMLDSMHTHIR